MIFRRRDNRGRREYREQVTVLLELANSGELLEKIVTRLDRPTGGIIQKLRKLCREGKIDPRQSRIYEKQYYIIHITSEVKKESYPRRKKLIKVV